MDRIAVLGVNHIDLYSLDPTSLRHFYLELLAGEPLDGFHDPLRVGSVQLAFHQLEPGAQIGGVEIAFDADTAGYVGARRADERTRRRRGSLERFRTQLLRHRSRWAAHRVFTSRSRCLLARVSLRRLVH